MEETAADVGVGPARYDQVGERERYRRALRAGARLAPAGRAAGIW